MTALRLLSFCFAAALTLAAPARSSADCLSAAAAALPGAATPSASPAASPVAAVSREAAALPGASQSANAPEATPVAAPGADASEAAPAAGAAVVAMPEAVYVSSQGQRLAARFDIPAKTVRLALPDGRTLTLPLAVSGSGARYSNGAQTFWEHQGGAIFEERGVLLFEGRETPAR